jgi:hypothetical protein
MARVLFAVSMEEDQAQKFLSHLSSPGYEHVVIGKYTSHPEEMEQNMPQNSNEDHNLEGCDPMTLIQMDLAFGEMDTEFGSPQQGLSERAIRLIKVATTHGEKDPENKVIWYQAVVEADQCGGLKLREMAEIFMDGCPAMTLAYVDEIVSDLDDDDFETYVMEFRDFLADD